MTIQSINTLPKVSFEDLISGSSEFDNVKSNLQKYNSINPAKAFSPADMVSFKETTISKLDSYGPNLPSGLAGMGNSIQNLKPHELSSVLFGGGYNHETFSVSSFDFSLESLIRLNTSIMAYYTILQGGCEVLLFALKTTKALSDLSLEDLDIGSAISSFVGSISTEISKIAEAAAKSVTDIAEEIISSAESAVNAVFSTLNSLSEITLADVEKAIKDASTALVKAFNDGISGILSGVNTLFSGSTNLTFSCASHTKMLTEAKVANVKDNIDNLPNQLFEVNEHNLIPVQELLKRNADRVLGYTKQENVLKMKSQTAAIAKKYQENHPDADENEVANAVNRQVARGNESFDKLMESRRDYLQNQVAKGKAIVKDMSKSSNTVIADSALGKRPIVSKSDVVSEAKIYLSDNNLFDVSYFGPPYASGIAEKINTLHPKVRERFANAMRDLTKNEDFREVGLTFKITSALRSIALQQALYNKLKPQGKPVAFPGNSWHNYGCAIDIAIFLDGVYETNPRYYVGVARQIFAKYNMHNPFNNDSIHFQPKELALSPRKIRTTLISSRQTLNNQAIGNLLA